MHVIAKKCAPTLAVTVAHLANIVKFVLLILVVIACRLENDGANVCWMNAGLRQSQSEELVINKRSLLGTL